jgi:thiol-disulfide isomerase/thioredoxin
MIKRYLLLCAVAGLAACAQDLVSPANTPAGKVATGEIGSFLPEFTVKDLQGHLISSSELKGEVVIIDFWATWCGPCKQEMPGYQKLIDRYGAQGLVVVGLKSDAMADTENPLKFAKRIGVHYPLAVATDGITQKFGGIEGLPTTLLYDRRGVLRKRIVGFEYTNVVESDLKALL